MNKCDTCRYNCTYYCELGYSNPADCDYITFDYEDGDEDEDQMQEMW